MDNFNGGRFVGVPIAVTTSSAATALNPDMSDAAVDNRGDADAYIRFGLAGVTVDVATGLRIPAGAIVTLNKGRSTHVACIGDDATSLVVHLGRGF